MNLIRSQWRASDSCHSKTKRQYKQKTTETTITIKLNVSFKKL